MSEVPLYRSKKALDPVIQKSMSLKYDSASGGIVLVGKTVEGARGISGQFERRSMSKRYIRQSRHM